MKTYFFLTTVILFLSCSSTENNSKVSQTITDRLQKVIDETVANDSDQLVGVSVSIRVGNEERWQLVGGISKPGQPVTADMKFGIASVTKTVVAATIMKLVDEGVLSLTDSIGDRLSINSPHIDNQITIFQLLSHYSGISGYMYTELWNIAEANIDQPINQIDMVNYIKEPHHPPGDAHWYSNANYLILGLIIEAATNKPVGEVMREKFWNPLNLSQVYFGDDEAIPEPICTPWRDKDRVGVLNNIKADYGAAFHSIFYCAADVFTTASDLSMWAQHLYNGDAISAESRAQMMTNYVEFSDPIFSGYGLGTRSAVFAGRLMWGHTGAMRGYSSFMFFDPISEVSIAILNNQSSTAEGPLLMFELFESLMQIVVETL